MPVTFYFYTIRTTVVECRNSVVSEYPFRTLLQTLVWSGRIRIPQYFCDKDFKPIICGPGKFKSPEQEMSTCFCSTNKLASDGGGNVTVTKDYRICHLSYILYVLGTLSVWFASTWTSLSVCFMNILSHGH